MVETDPGTINVLLRGEDYKEKLILSIRRFATHWRRKYLRLPPGLHQIILEGIMEGGKFQSAVIDDVTLWSCNDFGE